MDDSTRMHYTMAVSLAEKGFEDDFILRELQGQSLSKDEITFIMAKLSTVRDESKRKRKARGFITGAAGMLLFLGAFALAAISENGMLFHDAMALVAVVGILMFLLSILSITLF